MNIVSYGVNKLRKSASFEKERAIKLESHSRRNNLILYSVPEEVNETSVKTESLLYSFLEDELKLKEDDIDGISIERATPNWSMTNYTSTVRDAYNAGLRLDRLNNDKNDLVTRGSTSLHRKMCFGLPWRSSQTEYVFLGLM